MPLLEGCVEMHKKQKTDYHFIQPSYVQVSNKRPEIQLAGQIPSAIAHLQDGQITDPT